jgi:hypothetical protein
MEDAIDGTGNIKGLADIAFDELKLGPFEQVFDILATAGDEIVKRNDLMRLLN